MINNPTVDQRETVTLIGSDKVEGTPVYRPNGERVGTIQRVMIDKIGGQVAYAGDELRRLHGHRRGLLSAAMATPGL